jgi:protoporphyrinogen oxidase
MNYIIGAGLSGLSYAYHSKKKSTIFDTNKYTGGRIQSEAYKNNFIEGGAQFFSKEDPNIYGLIKKLNLEKEETIVSLNKFFVKRNSEFISIKNGESTQLTKEEARQIKEFHKKIKETLLIVEDFPMELIEMPFNKWYIKNIGKETEWIINGMMRAITFTDPKNQSALYGIIVCGTFFSECYSLNGGLQKITNKLISIAKPKINEYQRVDQINFNSKKASEIRVNNISIPINNNLVAAIPSIDLAKIVENSELSNKLKKIKYNGCAVLILNTNKKILNHDSGILYSEKKDHVAVMIDEPKYYNFKTKENIVGALFPYQEKPSKKFLLQKTKEKLDEITNTPYEITADKYFYWDYGLPEFNLKTYKLQKEINEITNQYDNFAICGDFMGLPSLDACVETAKKAVNKLKLNHC